MRIPLVTKGPKKEQAPHFPRTKNDTNDKLGKLGDGLDAIFGDPLTLTLISASVSVLLSI